MSYNVASSSAGGPVIPSSDFPTVATVDEVKGIKSARELNIFLKRRLNNVDNHVDTLTAQEVDGTTFLALKYEMLVSPPLNIPVGPALKLTELIKEIQGGK